MTEFFEFKFAALIETSSSFLQENYQVNFLNADEWHKNGMHSSLRLGFSKSTSRLWTYIIRTSARSL